MGVGGASDPAVCQPAVQTAARARDAIASWLCTAAVQTPHGGIAGCLDAAGRQAFVYGEVTGYWLRWAALAMPDAARMRAAVDFIGSQWSGPRPAATRLGAGADDWRNAAVFSFDLAMMLRGLAAAEPVVGNAPCAAAAARLLRWLEDLVDAQGLLMSHRQLRVGVLPDRWSTRRGPYQAKTAAALLLVPRAWLSGHLHAAATRTLADCAGRAAEHAELHARCYALEGQQLAGLAADPGLVMKAAVRPGELPEEAGVASGRARSDVQAQALRLLCLQPLRADGQADAVAAVLLRHVRADGSVAFRVGDLQSNVWCALFAHQALDWLCWLRGDARAAMPRGCTLV